MSEVLPSLRPAPRPALVAALWRGLRDRCPHGGAGRVLDGFLRVAPACGAELGRLRADDAPPYFTIFLVGHVAVPVILLVERLWAPPMWLHMALWLPLVGLGSALLLRPVKGATVGLMWRLGITGDDAKG